jgi:formate dehydrogenase major subunit
MVAWNIRGATEARAMVTERIPLLKVNNRVQHQIGIPFHWSFAGETTGGRERSDLDHARSEREYARDESVYL